MTDIVAIDLDMTIADSTQRSFRARQFADSRFVPEEGIIPSIVYKSAWEQIFYSERALYHPAWFPLDTLITGVDEAIRTLKERHYKIFFITSRPESTRVETYTWLASQCIWTEDRDGYSRLIMKPGAYTYTKTAIWKRGQLEDLAARYHSEQMLFVDDDEKNLEEAQKSETLPGLLVARSLAEACTSLGV